MKGEKNMFFSPFSVREALAMAAAGAGGTTLAQMNRVLQLDRFQNQKQSNSAFQSHLDSFCSNANFTLTTANRIYVQKKFTLKTSFIETLKKYFFSGPENVDFDKKPKEAANLINRWITEKTNNAIQGSISPASLSDTVVMLVNAIYFKGKWRTKFETKDTQLRDFHLADGRIIQVPTMFAARDAEYTYSSVLKSQVVQLDYEGGRVAMHIILPESGTNLSWVQKKLNSKTMNDYLKDFFWTEVFVYFPKFKAVHKEEMLVPLRKLGMSEVFGGSANLSRMSAEPNVSVSSVFHEAFVAVDEEGTVAAAVTTVEKTIGFGTVSAGPSPVFFIVDRPCIYLIYDRVFKQILFMGNLDEPKQ